MLEENKETIQPGEEITDWYIPKETKPQEVEGVYIHAQPLPENLRSIPAEKSHSHKWMWIFIGIFATLVLAAVIITLILRKPRPEINIPDDKDSNPSSIISVFNSATTTIPRGGRTDGVKLWLEDPGQQELPPQDIYDKVSPATVIVLAQQGENTSVGTGVIMSADGYVITNAHVIAGAESAGIVLYGQYLFDAELVGYDADVDIAVLKALDAEDLPVAEFSNSDLCRVGDTVYAIGNPLGVELYGTMSDGILSAINRNIEIDDHEVTVLQTTAALNNGNSGGPLINTSGQVIGINTLKMGNVTDSNAVAQVESLGFALPMSDVSFVVNDIISTGSYHGAPSFGITVVTAKDTDGNDIVIIYSVEEGSAAFDAGMQEGDVILTVDGQSVSNTAELLKIRRSHKVGDTVNVRYWRAGETKIASVTLKASK